jgi:signal transduction histidine kinase
MVKSLTGGTLGGLAKAFSKKLEMKEEEERKRIARDRHHEMSNNFDL